MSFYKEESKDALYAGFNIIDFNGSWVKEFDKNDTKPDYFHHEDTSNGMAYFMKSERDALIGGNDICTMLRLPMSNGSFCMDFLLPDEGISLNELIDNLDLKGWNDMESGLESYKKVEIKLPKFEMYNKKIDLKESLKMIGMQRAFTSEAELSGIIQNRDDKIGTFIRNFFQQTNLSMDEGGVKVQVATVFDGTIGAASCKDKFHANRPFLFIISENSTSAILFMGKISRFRNYELY